jgi:formylglycine-generating enzyme required for sulfatase activity
MFISIITCFALFSNFVDANTQRAKAYFFVAEEAFENQDYQKTLEALDKVESMLGNSNARILALRIRTNYQLENYIKAKNQLDQFWKMNASDDLVRSVASIDVYIEEKLLAEKKAQKSKLLAEKKEQEVLTSKLQSIFSSLVNIPAGSFQMGSNDEHENEKPVHIVNIKAFKMMEHEVTWALYQPCINDGACPNNTENGGDEGWGKGNRPMINVSYNDIVNNYIPWLNRKTGQVFRLPTEAEWEYAARANSTTKYSWGNTIDCSKARYGYYSKECVNQKFTGSVKSYSPNQWGLYDLNGNVWEWVRDCWHDNYSDAPNNGEAWMSDSGGDCDKAVVRGGSWYGKPNLLRSAVRVRFNRNARYADIGFRLVKGM